MKKSFIFFLLLTCIVLNAQNLDSLYNTYVNNRMGVPTNIKADGIFSVIDQPQKCAFGIANEIKNNLHRFTYGQQIVLQKLLNRPSTDTSIVSPKGYFRIHFDKSKLPDYVPDAVRNNLSSSQLEVYKRMYLDSLAIAADSVYNFEVNILNYPPPPADGTAGGDDKYDIYIVSMPGYYGETVGDETIGEFLYTSYARIDDTFTNTNTKRYDGARVTIAHEFHHAIQMGNYGLKTDNNNNHLDVFFYEITSTSMEEFVFDEVNDYYFYMNHFFNNPAKSFSKFANRNYDGYDLAIWNLFMKSRFDIDIIKRTWELMKNDRAMNAIANAINERGSSFKKEFSHFALWLYFTGKRAVPGKYFEEAANYPLVRPIITSTFFKPETSFDHSSLPLSINIFAFNDNDGGQENSFISLIDNCDISSSIDDPNSTNTFKYRLSNQSSDGFKKIIDGYYSKLESTSDFVFTETNIFNNTPVDSGVVTTEDIEYPFPQPMILSLHENISLPANQNASGKADVYIYSIDMDLIYSGVHSIYNMEKTVVQWNCKDNNGNKLASGVYFYFVKSGDDIKKGKFVIIDDN